jgi:hypothetical protein
MSYILRHTLALAGTALIALGGVTSCAVDAAGDPQVSEAQAEPTGTAQQQVSCIPDGGIDDTLGQTSCCSGYAVQGTTVCANPQDYGGSWASCNQFCGTAPVNGCIASGGWDDTLGLTRCCSGQAVPGSTRCLDARDYGTDWVSCIQQCL